MGDVKSNASPPEIDRTARTTATQTAFNMG